ncbi:MAG: sigma-70 family RNA polymerase sigma factor [Oscillospiraceae bacterium]|nr:sigma-70 family RNA polymerase sigma factor [Oscillospiraceae bacterium]
MLQLFNQDNRACDLEQLVRLYGDEILRLCYMHLYDRQLAEDAAQETFVKAFQKASTFRNESQVKTWLTRIAINTCKDFRRTAWFRHVDRQMTAEDLPHKETNIDTADDSVIVEVMNLPIKYRTVILLRFYQEMGFAEIAETLGIPIGTVSTRLDAAKRILKTKLVRWYFDE